MWLIWLKKLIVLKDVFIHFEILVLKPNLKSYRCGIKWKTLLYFSNKTGFFKDFMTLGSNEPRPLEEPESLCPITEYIWVH